MALLHQGSVWAGRSRAFIVVVFVFGDMYVLDKYLPLSHIPDPKVVHFLDIAGRSPGDNSGQDKELRSYERH